jgi:membrane protease YdiL (CAAX protease family)
MIADSSKAVLSDGRVGLRPLKGLAYLFLVANCFLLYLPNFVPCLRLPGSHWNWSGKMLAIAFSCLVLAWSPWLRQNIGLRWRQSPGSIWVSLPCFLVCLGSGIASGFYVSQKAFSPETLLFQLFMPTLDEELAFRGIALALLEREFGQSPMSCRLRYGWAAFILALIFGFAHAVTLAGGHIGLSLPPLVITFYIASVLTIARIRSGSLLWPMLCHSASNVALFTVAMMR